MARTKKVNNEQENKIRMTQSAYDELVQERDYRVNELRLEIAKDLATAANEGDLSENHAYSDAMLRKELNENRILELEEVILKAEIAIENTSDNFVSVGEKVEVQNLETKEKRTVVLVGSEDTKAANPSEGKISTDSPIGKAILNSRVGDIVEVKLPSKTVSFKVLKLIK